LGLGRFSATRNVDPYTFGHVKPLRLALLLTHLGKTVDPARELAAVYVYRGRPGPKSGSRAQAASARQFDAWESHPLVEVKTRPLRYQPTTWSMGKATAWRAQEKGTPRAERSLISENS